MIRIRDECWIVARRAARADGDVVDVRGCDRTNRGTRARFLLPFERVDRIPPAAGPRVVSARRWRQLARGALAGASPGCGALRAAAGADLDILPFQLEPALAVIGGAAARILIADEVGLGKTVQAGLAAAEILMRDPDAHVLVLVPASLREQWDGELRDRFQLSPLVIDSAALARAPRLLLPGANPWSSHSPVIASIDFVKRPEVLRSLEAIVWDLVVVDEAHALAGRSDRHAAAALLGERARTVLLLTATPHPGDEAAFGRVCGVGDLDGRFPLLVFRRTRDDAGLPVRRRTTSLAITPTGAELDMHAALLAYARQAWSRDKGAGAARLAMLVLLRRACSSPASLARSIERRLDLLDAPDDGASQLALPFTGALDEDAEPGGELAAPGLDDPAGERAWLERILALARRAAESESKMQAVRRLLRRTREPALVFTEYRDTLATLARHLEPLAIAQLHGGLAASERTDVIRAFTSGDVAVLLATDAASEGLNLHHRCRLAVHLELPWTPTRLEQRVGRVDRLGQRRRVHEIRLVARGTREADVVAPLVYQRGRRATRTLAALRPHVVDERLIGERVLDAGHRDADDVVADDPLPEGLIVGDLRSAAIVEADRTTAARMLAGGRGAPVESRRPFAAAVQRACSRGCGAFRLAYEDAEDAIAWETIVGAWYALPATHRFRSPADVHRHLAGLHDALAARVGEAQQHLLADLRRFLHSSLAVPVSRERALLNAVEARRARLAATLVQPGLFDRRALRDTAARREILRETLARCDRRLARLIARQQVRPSTPEPVFAALLP